MNVLKLTGVVLLAIVILWLSRSANQPRGIGSLLVDAMNDDNRAKRKRS